MGLTEIANDVARHAAAKELGHGFLERLKGCFEESGFKGIENHLRQSGFSVIRENYSDGSGDYAYAVASVTFAKNGLECSVGARLHNNGQGPVFHFERSDKPQRIVGRELEARTEVGKPEDAYPLIQDFVMENLPQLSRAPGFVEYVKKRTFG